MPRSIATAVTILPVLVAGFIGDGHLLAQDCPVWHYRATPPEARSQHAMAYDSGHGVTLLYGGKESTPLSVLTWE